MISRRTLLASLASPLLAQPPQPIIDIHQHTSYSGRSDAERIAHQRDMGITVTVLLPAGSKYGLAAGAGVNDTVVAIARQYPKEYRFFANELPDIPEARPVIERYLKMGALGIGEQKFPVEADSPHIDLVAAIAREHGVPVLMHFEHGNYNRGIDKFARRDLLAGERLYQLARRAIGQNTPLVARDRQARRAHPRGSRRADPGHELAAGRLARGRSLPVAVLWSHRPRRLFLLQ